jgi:hypothetical protein
MSTDRRDDNTFHKPVTFKDTVTFEMAPTIGTGAGSPSQAYNKVDAGTFDLLFQNGGVNRWAIRHDASENLLIRRFNGTGVLQDTITFNATTGSVSMPVDLAVVGAVTAADVTATDDLSVGDDALIGGDLAVTGGISVGGSMTGVIESVILPIHDVTDAAALFSIIAPCTGDIISADLVLNNAPAMGAVNVQLKIGATNVTDGSMSIADGAAAGTIGACSPSAARTVTERTSVINAAITGANSNPCAGNITIRIRKTA